jgi:hypothetical protein
MLNRVRSFLGFGGRRSRKNVSKKMRRVSRRKANRKRSSRRRR